MDGIYSCNPVIKKRQGTLIIYPSGYDNIDIQGRIKNVQKMYTSYENNTYGAIYADSLSSIWMYLIFDTSLLPVNATITSASCLIRLFCQMPTRKVQMYSQGNGKGNEKDFSTNANNPISFDLSDWTISDFNDCKIKIFASRTSGTSNLAIAVYGATLTINYEYY